MEMRPVGPDGTGRQEAPVLGLLAVQQEVIPAEAPGTSENPEQAGGFFIFNPRAARGRYRNMFLVSLRQSVLMLVKQTVAG